MFLENHQAEQHSQGGSPATSRPDHRRQRQQRPKAASQPLRLIGATYLHRSTGRPVVVIDHEYRRPRTDGGRSRTGRVIVRYADTPLEILFVTGPTELLEQLTLPCVAPPDPAKNGSCS